MYELIYEGRIKGSLGGEDQRYDQSIQRQRLSEDQNQNHAHEDLLLLRVGPHTRVSHDPDCKSSSLSHSKSTSELKPQQRPEARWA